MTTTLQISSQSDLNINTFTSAYLFGTLEAPDELYGLMSAFAQKRT